VDTLGVLFVLVTGTFVIALSYLLDHLWAAALPVRPFYLFIRLPGVVLHECSHSIGCLLTGARIRSIVFFSKDGGSVTYSRPKLPFIGDVIISTAPLFLLPLALSGVTWAFGTFLGCTFPVFPATLASPGIFLDLANALFSTFSENLLTRFNGWFLLYLYLALSLILSVAPSTQDMKNAAAGMILMTLVGVLVVLSGIPLAVSVLSGLVLLLGYGFMLGLVYGLVVLAASLPLLFWYTCKRLF
jgi:hypothetical protein